MRTGFTQKMTLAALMCALISVCSQIQIPLPPVPLSLSLLAVYLAGSLLGPSWSASAAGAYVLLGATGLPVYAGFAGGVSVLFGPTGGFLIGYIPCAWLCGRLVRRFGFSRRALILAMSCGTLACYLPGSLWFMLLTGTDLSGTLAVCVLPFLPGDALKVLLAAALARRMEKPLRSMGL